MMKTLKADICVIGGMGHVGLPLAIVFASKGLRVIAYDINKKALETVSSGTLPFLEEGAEPLLKQALKNGNLILSDDPSSIAQAQNIIITIGTPVDEFLNPTFRDIQKSFDSFLPYFNDEQLIILRSTVYPGTTEWVSRYLQKNGKKTMLSFCPERIVQGYAVKELQQFPQIISGTTPKAEEHAAKLFEVIAPEVVRLSTQEAEFAKLFANSYRYIQFAVANQFYMMADSAGLDFYRILSGMKKDYPRAAGIPGAGLAAGPCLFKDTMQLSAFSNNQFNLGHAAMLVNEGLVLYMVEKIGRNYDLSKSTVGLLGMAFKADSDDSRSSLSYKLKKALSFRAKDILTTDPYIKYDAELVSFEKTIEESDLLILCVPHTPYLSADFQGKPVMDIWGALRNSAADSVQTATSFFHPSDVVKGVTTERSRLQ